MVIDVTGLDCAFLNLSICAFFKKELNYISISFQFDTLKGKERERYMI